MGISALRIPTYLGIQGDLEASLLFDTGADYNYLNAKYTKHLPSSCVHECPTIEISSPGGTLVSTREARVPVRMGDYNSVVTFKLVSLPKHDDGYLGFHWIRSVQAQVDWDRLRLTVKDSRTGQRVVVTSDTKPRRLEPDDASLNALSLAQFDRVMRKPGSCGFLVHIKRNDVKDETLPDLSALPTTQDPDFMALIKEQWAIFRSELPPTLPPQRDIDHRIDTGENPPVNINSYALSLEKLEEECRQVAELLEKGLIRPSSSPWGFPVVFVRKADGKSWRMCIDYRALNKVTKRNTYPLPRINECLADIGDAQFLSIGDLTSGFYQLRVHEPDIAKTAFNTKYGKYEFVAMPFGLTNAPATFQTMMNRIFAKHRKFCIVYLDDILVFSKTKADHLRHLKIIFEELRRNNLYLNPKKCRIAQKEVQFVGHIVGSGTLKPIHDKVKAIQDWPEPRTVHEVRQFLGLASYYRKFIKDFAKIAVPLHELLKCSDSTARQELHRKVTWNAQCRLAFDTIKCIMSSSPVLVQPVLNRSFVIETDASDWALGCVLLQEDVLGKMHPVAYDGRKFQGAELNYSVQDKELLAIKHALRLWRNYIENGTRTKVITDHSSLVYLQTTKEPSRRLERWIAEFGDYDLDIQYRKGSEAIVPDAISRRPDFIPLKRRKGGLLNAMTEEREFEWYDALVKFLDEGVLPSDIALASQVKRDAESTHFHVDSRSMGLRLLRVTPEGDVPVLCRHERQDFLNQIHKEYGHVGHPSLTRLVQPRAWWRGLTKDCEWFSKNCPACCVVQPQATGQDKEYRHVLSHPSTQPFDRWGIDLIGILPETPNGNRWIITAIDYATGWPLAKATKTATANDVADFIQSEIFTNYGPPKELLSDNGANLLAESVQHYVDLMKTKYRHITPYHPRTNGKVENFNGLLGKILTKYLLNKPTRLWDEYLEQALYAVRVHTHSRHGHSPFYLLYGVQPRLPSDPNPVTPDATKEGIERMLAKIEDIRTIRQQANQKLVENAHKYRLNLDEQVQPHRLEEGDYVFLRNESKRKFEPPWFGPYKIAQKAILGTYRLETPQGRIVKSLIHGNRVRKADLNMKDNQSIQNLWFSRYTENTRTPEEVEDEFLESSYSLQDLGTISKETWKLLQRRLTASGVAPSLVREELTSEQNAPVSNQEPLVRHVEPIRSGEPTYSRLTRKEVRDLVDKDLARRRRKPQAKSQFIELDRVGNSRVPQPPQVAGDTGAPELEKIRERRFVDAQLTLRHQSPARTERIGPPEVNQDNIGFNQEAIGPKSIHNNGNRSTVKPIQQPITSTDAVKGFRQKPKNPVRLPKPSKKDYDGSNQDKHHQEQVDAGSTYNDRDHPVALPNRKEPRDTDVAPRERTREGLRPKPKPKKHFE